MTTLRADLDVASSDSTRLQPALLGLGTALPGLRVPQAELARDMTELWRLEGARRARFQRIIEGSGVESRHGVVPIDSIPPMTTAERMRLYERHAPGLAEAAARRALDDSDVDSATITDLLVVSCTGFRAPGVDVELIRRLGLSPSTRRATIGFMGCFGAITALRQARAIAASDASATVLVVCVELCSLHLRPDPDPQNQVAAALFADGAAAAVVGRHESTSTGRPLPTLTPGASLLLPEGADWMTWTITDAGFAMTLTRDVPAAIRARLADFVADTCEPLPASIILHPGGPGVIDAAEEALTPILPTIADDAGLRAARAILRTCGNMSSTAVLFVLEEAQRHGAQTPSLLLAFGPGLTIEALGLESAGDHAPNHA